MRGRFAKSPAPPDTTHIAAHIRERGWSVATIFEGDRDIGASFAYSIGLHETCGTPEIIITGQPGNVAATIINTLGESIHGTGPLPVNVPLSDLLEGDLKCVLKSTSPEAKNKLGLARAYYSHWNFQLVQCVWPDRAGLFPWEPGCATLAADQPLLFAA